jgi:hypothetical protein
VGVESDGAESVDFPENRVMTRNRAQQFLDNVRVLF